MMERQKYSLFGWPTTNAPFLPSIAAMSTGKTTSVHALARELLGPAYKDACLELNASDARGIDVVRNRIKSFAQNKVTLPPGRCVHCNHVVVVEATIDRSVLLT